jgi:hypothetical protein
MTSLFAKTSFQQALGVILIVLSLATVIIVAIFTARLSDVTECQARYNEAYTTAIRARSDVARSERQAQRELWTTVLKPEIPIEQKREAFGIYLKKLDEADRIRDAAELPTRRC